MAVLEEALQETVNNFSESGRFRHERDTNIAILEQNPTIQGEQEVRKLKGEKDHLVDQLKQLVKIAFVVFSNLELLCKLLGYE